MKLIKTANSIISLENVRRVDLNKSESKHTRNYGEKYTITDYTIFIHYNNNTCERIECGEDASGKMAAETWFSKIADILSDDPA